MAQHVFPPPDSGSDAFHDEEDASSVDARLVERALRGDGDAFAVLFDRHAPRVYALAYRILGRDGEAEDVTQDAFLHALNALPMLRRGESFRPWVMRIATNLAWATLRQRLRLPQAELTDAVVETHPDTGRWGSPEAMGLAAEDQRAVRLTLDRLAPTHRAALAMREIGGLSYADIAASLGTTTGSIEALLFRARARFRDEYRKVELGAGATAVGAAATLSCVHTPRVLAVLADHEGSDEERVRAAAHARQCDICAAQLRALKDSRTLLLALPLTVPAAIRTAVLSKAGPILVSHAAMGGAVAGALTAAGGLSAGGAGASVVAASGAGAAAGGTAAGASASVLSIVGAGGLAAKIAAIAVVAAIAAAVVVVKHASPRHTLSQLSTSAARGVTPTTWGGSGGSFARLGGGALTRLGGPSPFAQATRTPSLAATRAAAASQFPALHRFTVTPTIGRVARGNMGGSGPGAVGTAGATMGTPTAISAFGGRSGATGRATAQANDARASAIVTSGAGAAGMITSATRFGGGPTAAPTVTTITIMPGAITTPAMTAPAVVTPAVNGSGGVVGGAAGTATAAPSFVPTVTSTPVALALTATSVPAGPSPTKTPVLGVRTSVAYVATATVWPTPHETTRVDAHSTARATVRADMSATPRAIKPVIVRANNGRPARPASRSIPAVPIASGNTGRSTSGVAAPSPTPMRPAPTVSPTNAARAVILPPLAKLVATPAAGNSSSAVANVTALPGGVATTIGNNVASAPTVVATLIPALPTITAAAPSVIPSVSTALPLPTILVSGTGTVVASDTPASTIPAALPISIPTVAPTIEDPGTVTATLGAIPTAVPSVPVPPDSSNVTPTAIASGIPSVIAAAPTATAMATGVSGVSTPTETPIVVAAATDIPTTVVTMLPTTAPTTTIATETATATATPSSALLSSQDIGNVGVAGSTLDVAGIYTLMGSGADIGGTADAFHFAYLSLVGDGQIVAHVAAQTDTDPQAKAGVMIRETLDPSARFADMVLTPDRGVAFQQRTEPGANAAHTELDGVAAPAWVKLARSGSTLTGFVSSDGMTWTPVGTDTVPMSTTVYVGLAVTAHNNALLNTALFDHVVVSAGAKGRRNTYSFQAHPGM